jgi:hypothetical protein
LFCRLLQTWPDIPPTDALELLNHHFVDKNIREFAVSQLQRLSDDDLQDFLLQLVQVLTPSPLQFISSQQFELFFHSKIKSFLQHCCILGSET